MKGKRGQAILSSLIYAVVELAIVAMFIAAVLVKVNASVSDTTYQKRFYARDLALATDSIMAAEGDFQLEYGLVTKKPLQMDVMLRLGSIAVSETAEDENDVPSEISFLYGSSTGIKVEPYTSKPTDSNSYEIQEGKYARYVVLKKQGNAITLAEPDNVEKAGDIELK